MTRIRQLGAMLKTVTVEPVLFLYMMIIFMESNALKEIIYTKSCLQIRNPLNVSECKNKSDANIMNTATFWMKYNNVCLFSFTLIISFYVATWSDKFGRKFTMIVPLLGTMIASAINCALSFHLNAHVAYFLVSSAISGITFGTVGIIASAFGYVADVTDEVKRTKRIVILEAMLFIGGTVGIYLGGAILKDVNLTIGFNQFAMLFIFEMVVAAVTTVYVVIRIPSYTDEEQSMPVFSCLNIFGCSHVKDSLKTILQSRPEGKRKKIILLLLALTFVYLGSTVHLTLSYYYLKNKPIDWNFSTYSNYNSLEFGVKGVALLIGLPVALHFLHLPDHFIAVLGALSRTAGFLLFGIAKNEAMVYSCAALLVFSEYPVPAIRSMLSKIVDKDEKGRIFAFTTVLQNLCFLFSNLTLITVYEQTVNIFPGLCFEVVAVLQALAIVICGYLYFTRTEEITTYEIMQNEDGSYEEYQYSMPNPAINN